MDIVAALIVSEGQREEITQKYWQDQILALREQAALMDEPPLEIHL